MTNCHHTPVILTINTTFIRTIRQPALTSKRTDWDLFRDELEQKINLRIPLITNEQLDEAAEQLTKAIQQAAWAATPPATARDICKLDYPIEVKELVKEKRLARKRWQETRDPEDKTNANRLSQQLKRLLHKIKNENINYYLKNLTYSKEFEYSLWKATRKLRRPKIYNPQSGKMIKLELEITEVRQRPLRITWKKHFNLSKTQRIIGKFTSNLTQTQGVSNQSQLKKPNARLTSA